MVGFSFMGLGVGFFGILFAVVLVWSFIWKGLALWKSARLGQKWWFIAMLLINSVGILEILYIYYFSEKKSEPAKMEV